MSISALVHIIVLLVVFGLIAWLILTYIPMPEPIKRAVVVVIVLCIIVLLLQTFGIFA